MQRHSPSASLVALTIVAALLVVPATAMGALVSVKSVGEIFVDARGRASGENLATKISEAEGLIEDFHALASDSTVFDSIRIDGFEQAEKIAGVGSSLLTLKGDNAVVTLHDNAHSVVKVKATQATTVTYRLASGITALQEGRHGAVVRLTDSAHGYVGHLVAVGTEGPSTRGEVVQTRAGELVARAQPGTELVFLGKAAGRSEAFQQALVDALAEGSFISHYVTEFEGSSVASSQVDAGVHAAARTSADVAGVVATTLTARGSAPTVLAYDLAYETLPARSPEQVALYVDGALAQRVKTAGDVLAAARSNVPSYHATVADGRTQILAAAPKGGEHRLSISVGASASTEQQGQAESSGEESARVYGDFEHHPNGKLTGAFLTSVLPDDRAMLLSFTALATRTEIFRSASIDGGAQASFHAAGAEMRIATAKADVTLVDDAYATMIVRPKAPVDAVYELASGVRARRVADDILVLEGPHGPAGALVLRGDAAAKAGASLAASGQDRIEARLVPGVTLLYRGAPDAHASEDALLRALAAGELGAQLLAGIQDGALATRATTFAQSTSATIEPDGRALRIHYATGRDDARSFALDVRGSALVARSASDVRVSVDGVAIDPAEHAEDVLAGAGAARYHAATSLDGALRVIVRAGTGASTILVESLVEEAARAQARTDSFGAFKLFHDGTAVGSFVTLKADRAAGAVSGFTMVAEGQPVFASLVAGQSSFVSTGADGASVLTLQNREARLEISDSTNGFTKVHALQQTEAAFRLAAGLRVDQRAPGVVEILSAKGEHVGSLVIARGGELESRGEHEVRARLAMGGELIFRTHAGIESELSAAQRTMINQAIAAGRVAGQVIVQTQASATASAHGLERTARTESEGLAVEARNAQGELTSAVTASYSDVQLLTAATKERVEITVASASKVGKTLIISLDPDTIPGMALGKASIKFDGELAAQASSYADILDANDDGDIAEYFVLAGDAGTQVLVSIPYFSVHTVTLEQRAERSDAIYMYATLFLGLLVVVESALLARGARKNTLNTRRP